jgi:transposase
MILAELTKLYEHKFQLMEAEFSKKLLDSESELATYKKRCEQYEQAYDSLQHQVKELLRHRFGKKSERFIDPENKQLSLLEENDIFAKADFETDSVDETTTIIPAHSRKKKSKSSHADWPHRIEIIPVDDGNKQCSCGMCKAVIRYETKELIHYVPPIMEILEQRREVVACPKGCDGQIITASAPLCILPKIKVTPELLAFLIVSKCDDRQPLYHLERMLRERHGFDCSRQTMARWFIDLMFPLQPIYNLLKDMIIAYDIAACDATGLQVLHEPGRPAELKSYVYCMRGGSPDKPIIFYDYNAKLHKQFVKDWFEGFKGYLHVDGDDFFELVGNVVDLVNCNAHARRKFEPITKATKGNGIAKEAMHFYKKLYKIERKAKDNKMTPEQRYELRQRESKPLMDEFKKWLDTIYPTVLPQSPLGNAINYCIKFWPGLMRFLDDGRLEADNNLTEQAIKPFVIARKNFMFCDSVDGANALCMHFGIIRTAKANGLDPYHYYVKLLKGIPHCKTVEDYEQLLPWNIKLANQ